MDLDVGQVYNAVNQHLVGRDYTPFEASPASPTYSGTSPSPSKSAVKSDIFTASKRDIWARGPYGDSIFAQWNDGPHPVIAPTTETPTNKENSSLSKVSKNSIFDMPQTISKPALKMTEEELAELRAGRIPATEKPACSQEGSGLMPARESITIPVRRKVLADEDTSMQDATAPPSSVEATTMVNATTKVNPPPLSVLLPATSGVSHIKSHKRHDSSSLLLSPLLDPRPTSPMKSAFLSGLPYPLGSNAHKFSLGLLPSPAMQKSPDVAGASSVVYDDFQLMFFPTKKNFLGEGRYSHVFLGSYISSSGMESYQPDSRSSEPEPTPCAVKRYHATAESQTLGYSELFILRRLAMLNHPNLIRLIGAKDDSESEPSDTSKNVSVCPVSSVSSTQSGHNNGGIDSPKISEPMPRLLLVLELCGGGTLYRYVRRNGAKIGRRMWMKFARQLASAVESIHKQGLIHHDIKPHNCLVRL